MIVTIIVSAAIAVYAAFVVYRLVKKHRDSKGACCASCSGCCPHCNR